jgi:uncharacterized protein (DUF488 family)
MEIYTIGHSTHEIPEFIELLNHYGIDVIIDVRSSPYSRHVPQFNRESLYQALEASGVAYCFMGAVLGGRPKDLTCYTSGEVDYDLIRQKDWFQQAIDHLIELISEPGNYALMCSEADPLTCHRHNLLARELVDRDITVLHIIPAAGAPTLKQAEFISQETLF